MTTPRVSPRQAQINAYADRIIEAFPHEATVAEAEMFLHALGMALVAVASPFEQPERIVAEVAQRARDCIRQNALMMGKVAGHG